MKQTLCTICAAETGSFFNETFQVTYHVCPDCQLIFKEPEDLISREDEFEIYEYHENSLDDPKYVAYFRRFLEAAVFPFDHGGKDCLDFGSGPEPVLARILERDYGYRTDLYDFFYAPDKIYRGKTYDLVVSTEVVEHFADPMKHFRTMRDAMKTDGILAIMTQFHHQDPEHFSKWHYMRDRSHIAFYTRKTMQTIADRLDLQIIYCDNERYTTFRRKPKQSSRDDG